jgi:hypothetical protein
MSIIVVDVEADGPCPGLYSMVSVGAVVLNNFKIEDSKFFAQFEPISGKYVPEALAVSGYTRAETLQFPPAHMGMEAFNDWIKSFSHLGRPMFFSDNNGFDWQFVNYYFHAFLGHNPFGFSSTNIGSLYKGMACDLKANFKKLRMTKHDHNPVNDATGNAEALMSILRRFR